MTASPRRGPHPHVVERPAELGIFVAEGFDCSGLRFAELGDLPRTRSRLVPRGTQRRVRFAEPALRLTQALDDRRPRRFRVG